MSLSNSSSWARQTLEKVHNTFYSHTNQIPLSKSEELFLELLRQYQQTGEHVSSQLPSPIPISECFMWVALWGLSRMHVTDDFESRRQFNLFINHLQDAEQALLKSIQINKKTAPYTQPVPSAQVVASLPVTMQQMTNL